MGKKSSSSTSKPLTRSDTSRTKEKRVAITEPGKGRNFRPSALNRRKHKPNKTDPSLTPVWIQYYIRESENPLTAFGKGCRRPNGFFEELMDKFVSNEDHFYEILKQHPEACALVYADGGGLMRIIHHLTPEVHGDAIVVGLEGFGGKSSKVKVVNCKHFVAPVELDREQAILPVPDLMDFITTELVDIQTKDKSEPGGEAAEIVTVSQILGGAPKCFLIHPKWMSIIHQSIGESPVEMVEAILKFARGRIGCAEDYQGYDLLEIMDEFHPFLIFLWACHNKWICIDSLPRTYPLESSKFESIASNIISKTLLINGPNEGVETTQPGEEKAEEKASEREATTAPEKEAPQPTFNHPPPVQPREVGKGGTVARRGEAPGGGGDSSDDSDTSEEERRKPPKGDHNKKRKRKTVSRSRSRSVSSQNSRSRSRSERRGRSDRRRRSRSESRGRHRHRSISPPRYSRRRAGESERKRKTLADKLTEEQLRAFTLLSARDWDDRNPEMSRKMERLLDQTTLLTAISMFRSEISHGKWKGDLPDSAIAQFLQQGILAIDGETSPSGFSLFFIQPKTYGSKNRCTEQMRKERLSQDFGKGGVSEEAIARLAKLEYHVPRNYEDLVIMVDTGIKWLDFCTGHKSIASRGLRSAACYIEDYRAEIHRIILRDPHANLRSRVSRLKIPNVNFKDSIGRLSNWPVTAPSI